MSYRHAFNFICPYLHVNPSSSFVATHSPSFLQGLGEHTAIKNNKHFTKLKQNLYTASESYIPKFKELTESFKKCIKF